MSIRPPSDLVLDVVRAADPARAAAATARLARAEAQAAPATKAAFETALRVAAPSRAGSAAGADKSAAVGKGLEEMLMRQLLQDALPKKAAAVYGAGTAGDVWRSLFAEQLAHAMASAGRVGLSARLVKTGAAA